MSHVTSAFRYGASMQPPSDQKMKEIMNEDRWKQVQLGVSAKVLKENFNFLNDAVVIRSGAVGIPLMTTTGIYGPIEEDETVQLEQGGKVVKVLSSMDGQPSLLEKLKSLRKNSNPPKPGNSVKVAAKWLSGKDGGSLPNVGSSSNVFGATGSLLINEPEINFPVLDMYHKDFNETLAYYGAKLLQPNEAFKMGFDQPLFGIEYDTKLPDYINDYVMKPYGGGGLFVEHHPFPHIWFPNPGTGEENTNICRILLGRILAADSGEHVDEIESTNGKKCPDRKGNREHPEYHFTVFRIPSDGHALAVDECSIHNDSFCNGKQVVFLGNTTADTVALRKTTPFENLRISEKETPHD